MDALHHPAGCYASGRVRCTVPGENREYCRVLRTQNLGSKKPNLKLVEQSRQSIKVVAHRFPDLRCIMKYVDWTYLSEETPDTHNHACLELISDLLTFTADPL